VPRLLKKKLRRRCRDDFLKKISLPLPRHCPDDFFKNLRQQRRHGHLWIIESSNSYFLLYKILLVRDFDLKN
jgi:hypothetical protein